MLKEWNETLPTEEDQLDHPPRNQFAPQNIPNKRMAEKINGMPGEPKKIKEDEKSTVWFKQDDTHDQPYVWSRVEILCSDIDIMKDNFGKAFIIMWIEMFKERTRELNYMAKEAGVKFTI